MAEELAPYELQWLLFDFNRYFRFGGEGGSSKGETLPITEHSEWFDVAINDTARLKRRMRWLSNRSREVREFVENDPRYADFPKKLTKITHFTRSPPLNKGDEVHRILDLIEEGVNPRSLGSGPGPEDDPADVAAIEADIADAVGRRTRDREIEREIAQTADSAVSDD